MNPENLIEWLKKRGSEEDKSSKEWKKSDPKGQQTAYRAGAANTFLEVMEKIQSMTVQEWNSAKVSA